MFSYDEINGAFILMMAMRVLSAVLILGAGWVIGKYTQKKIEHYGKFDDTLSKFLGGFAKYGILAFALVIVLGQFGVETASLIALLGAAGLAIGLALQGTLSNIAAGVMMLALRPFNVGDYITFGSNGGTVKDMGLFSTQLATADNVYFFAPNSHIWGSEVFNYSRNDTRRQDIDFGISYNDDINKAIEVVMNILNNDARVFQNEDQAPAVLTAGMGESSIDLKARFWCNASDYWALKWELTKAIKEALDANGLTIPFPTRTLIQENAAEAANDSTAKPKAKSSTSATTKTKSA